MLIVDDDAALRQVAARAITAAQGDAFEARDGREAMSVLDRAGIDLAVIDVFMPEKDGLETITEAKQRWPGLKVIAVSGGGHVGPFDGLRLAQMFGADSVMTKPFGVKQLIAEIRRLTSSGQVGSDRL